LLASVNGWTLEYVRGLSLRDFKEQFLICFIKTKMTQKQTEALAGLGAVRNLT
jgi:hypothetical protein